MSAFSDPELAQLLPKIQDYGRNWFLEHNPTTVSSVLTKRGSFAEVLGRVYFQGRPDKMSFQVLDTVRLVLHGLGWETQEFDPWIESVSLTRLREDLQSKIGKGKVGRGRDVDLTVELIEWVKALPGHDVSAHMIELLSQSRLVSLYNELQQITSIGPKIASFVLRDFTLGLELAGKEPYPFKTAEEYLCVMPVDVHVAKAGSELGLPTEDIKRHNWRPPPAKRGHGTKRNPDLALALVRLCQRHNCSPLLVDQGMFGLNYLNQSLSSVVNPSTS